MIPGPKWYVQDESPWEWLRSLIMVGTIVGSIGIVLVTYGFDKLIKWMDE